MPTHGIVGTLKVLLGIRVTKLGRLIGTHALRQVAHHRVMSRRLVRQNIRHDAPFLQPLQHINGRSDDPYTQSLSTTAGLQGRIDSLIQIFVYLIQITSFDTFGRPPRLHFRRQADPFGHRDRQRLSPAHAAQSRRNT